jgi:hypothetical protein
LLLDGAWKGYIAWRRAAQRGSLGALQTLWSWAKKVGLNTDEILLAKNKQRYTARQLETKRLHLDALVELGVLEKGAQLNPQFRKRWKQD